MSSTLVRPARPDESAALAALHDQTWGGPLVIAHGVEFDLRQLSTLVAVAPTGDLVGALTYVVDGDELEVVSIATVAPLQGAGTQMLNAVVDLAKARAVRRVWLITTNDNLDALRFYQRRGMHIAAVHADAIRRSRAMKPSIPEIGAYGIPLRDEIVMELDLPDD